MFVERKEKEEIMSPKPCSKRVFEKGQSIVLASTYNCGAEGFEAWIVKVRELLPRSFLLPWGKTEIDWHYSGGIANVLYVGSREDVEKALNQMLHECPARILRFVSDIEVGPYRDGVTPAPEGAIAAFDGGFIVKKEEEKS